MNENTCSSTRHWLIIILFNIFACAPEGQQQRILHPTLKRFSERHQASGSASLASPSSAQFKGLPNACTIDIGKELCLHCQSAEWAVERCYPYSASLDPESDCLHTIDHVKCLARNPAFALYLELRSSKEKFLRENFLIWQNAVHQIWGEMLPQSDKEESARLLSSLDWLTQKFSTEPAIEATDGESLRKLLGLGAGASQACQNFVASLQQLRLAGQLTLQVVIDELGDFYEKSHGPSNLWREMRTMSLEGLDD